MNTDDEIAAAVVKTKEDILSRLHERCGLCSHCGKKKCAGKKSSSTLPQSLKTDDVLWAIDLT